MKINLLNTAHGLQPCYDADFDEKKKLKIGQIYTAEIKKTRNYEFHKKYFSLINLSWDYLNEKQIEFFKTKDIFRKSIEVSAGVCERVYNHKLKSWVDIPKSISFEKMDEAEFTEVYDNVLNVLMQTVFKDISEEVGKSIVR